MNGNYQNALENIDFVIRKFNPKNGKAEMIKGLILIALGDNCIACDFLMNQLNLEYRIREISKTIARR